MISKTKKGEDTFSTMYDKLIWKNGKVAGIKKSATQAEMKEYNKMMSAKTPKIKK